MARARPFGVGVGDWQTWYPVFRSHDRYRAFSETVRPAAPTRTTCRFFGELGWLGLAIWIVALVTAIGAAGRRAVSGGAGWDQPASAAAQLTALAVAAITDYLIEFPYCKFQLVLIVFLCVASSRRTTQDVRTMPLNRIGALFSIGGITVLATLNILYSVSLVRKEYLGAEVTQAYRLAVGEGATGAEKGTGAPSSVELNQIVALGKRFESTPGHSKTSYREVLLIADAWHRLGRDDAAIAYTHRALALHPHHPNAFSLMSRLSSDETSARDWQAASSYITHEAAHGFDRPYPEGHPLARDPG